MKKAVIFDLDGTLANTLACLADCSNEALKVCDLGPIAMEHFKTFVGRCV